MSLLWLLSTYLTTPSSSNFECVRERSVRSGTGDDDTITIHCAEVENGEYPIMVSCGFRAHDQYDQVDGGYMTSDSVSCTAKNGQGAAGVYAEARYILIYYAPINSY